MYAREIEGQVYSFGVSGKLIMNVLVMYDRQTDSLWSQLLGEAVEGPMTGAKLEFVPAEQTTWEDWVGRHPHSRVLVKGYRGARDSYSSYYLSSSAGVLGETRIDERLYVKEFVIGVEHEGEAVAYPYRLLSETPVVNDQVGDLPVVVIFNPRTAAGLVYTRSVDGRALTFEAEGEDHLRDLETGSLWDLHTGRALSGPAEAGQLTRVKSTSSFWFGWKDWHPATRVYEEP